LTSENLRKKGFQGPTQCPLCMQAEENIQHLFQECIFAKECWQQLISPLEIRINLKNLLPDFLQTFEKAYPYTTKKKATIKRIWKCIPVVLYWKIWLT